MSTILLLQSVPKVPTDLPAWAYVMMLLGALFMKELFAWIKTLKPNGSAPKVSASDLAMQKIAEGQTKLGETADRTVRLLEVLIAKVQKIEDRDNDQAVKRAEVGSSLRTLVKQHDVRGKLCGIDAQGEGAAAKVVEASRLAVRRDAGRRFVTSEDG